MCDRVPNTSLVIDQKFPEILTIWCIDVVEYLQETYFLEGLQFLLTVTCVYENSVIQSPFSILFIL